MNNIRILRYNFEYIYINNNYYLLFNFTIFKLGIKIITMMHLDKPYFWNTVHNFYEYVKSIQLI